MPLLDCHNHLGVDLQFYLGGSFPYAQDVPSLAAAAARLGLDRLVVFPMVSHRALGWPALEAGVPPPPGAAPAGVPYAFENRRMLEELHRQFPEVAGRFLPFAIVDPARDGAGQERALRALLAEHPIWGLKIQPTIIRSPVSALATEGRPVVELARERGLPFLIHSSIDPADRWSQCADILRLAEAFPDVRFCLAHSCRFHRPSLDRVAALPNAWFDCSAHRIHCQLAVEGHPAVAQPAERFDSDFRDPDRVLADLAAAYPGKLMWGSDSPFYSYVAPAETGALALKSTHEAEVACLRALPPGVQARVAWSNSLAFLGLDEATVLA